MQSFHKTHEKLHKADTMERRQRKLIDGKYQVLRRIAKGAFSVVIEVLNLETEQINIMKVQKSDEIYSNELAVLQAINAQQLQGVPQLLGTGQWDSLHSYLIFDKYGMNLVELFYLYSENNERLTWIVVQAIFLRMIKILKSIHTNGWIHGDVKPNNILLANDDFTCSLERFLSKDASLYLIDYGLSSHSNKKEDSSQQKEILLNNTGNIHFMSKSQIQNKGVQTFKDDLESLIYSMIFLYAGDLPWGFANQADAKVEIIQEKKLSTTTEQIAKNLPREFQLAIEYVFDLESNEAPDYALLASIISGKVSTYSKPQHCKMSNLERGILPQHKFSTSINFDMSIEPQILYQISTQLIKEDQTQLIHQQSKEPKDISKQSNEPYKNGKLLDDCKQVHQSKEGLDFSFCQKYDHKIFEDDETKDDEFSDELLLNGLEEEVGGLDFQVLTKDFKEMDLKKILQ